MAPWCSSVGYAWLHRSTHSKHQKLKPSSAYTTFKTGRSLCSSRQVTLVLVSGCLAVVFGLNWTTGWRRGHTDARSFARRNFPHPVSCTLIGSSGSRCGPHIRNLLEIYFETRTFLQACRFASLQRWHMAKAASDPRVLSAPKFVGGWRKEIGVSTGLSQCDTVSNLKNDLNTASDIFHFIILSLLFCTHFYFQSYFS